MKKINNLPVKRQVSVSGILKKLGVSRSGYNAWKKRVPSDTSVRRTVLKEKIQKIYDASHQNYGAPKITVELRKSGECVAEKTVGNYMRQMGIKAHWTFEGFVYLTSVMNLYSRKIISWVVSKTLEASHVVGCIEKAKKNRHIKNLLIFHCDRGCQYVSEAFRKATAVVV